MSFNDAPAEALAVYAQRWQIETLFARLLKTRRFNLEVLPRVLTWSAHGSKRRR